MVDLLTKGSDPLVGGRYAAQDLPGAIGGTIVDCDHLADRWLLEDVAEDDLQGPLLVEDGHHHGEKGSLGHGA
jgi:hypothetical protein